MWNPRRLLVGALSGMLLLASCGGSEPSADASPSVTAPTGGVRLVAPAEAQAALAAGATVLDIRTPEEYAAGHLAGAVNIDFYAPDFATRIAALDRGTPYVLYCRSGNRTATAAELMRTLGFTDVAEVDGGILAWTAAGLPLAG